MQGKLPDGTFIAVKKLSGKSKQGNREFVNEIGMISALQNYLEVLHKTTISSLSTSTWKISPLNMHFLV